MVRHRPRNGTVIDHPAGADYAEAMTIRVTFELEEKDLRHFRREMRRVRKQLSIADDHEIVDGARSAITDARKQSRLPQFVNERIEAVEALIDLVEDDAWSQPAGVRREILALLAYFGDPEDLIPDDVPGLGLLDDAIMIELVIRNLRHEIEAYEDFCTYRASLRRSPRDHTEGRHIESRLEMRRKALRERVSRREKKDGNRSFFAALRQ